MCGLEFLTQGNVPETITDRVERGIVGVVERSQDRPWVAVKGIDHARGDLGAPEHPLPDGGLRHGRHWHWLLATLEILPLLGVARDRRFHRRPDKLVARLQIERRPVRHPTRQHPRCLLVRRVYLLVTSKESWIIQETADIIALGNEIKNPGPKFIFPFQPDNALVKGNGPGGQRKGAVVIVADEVVEGQPRTGRNLPGKEVVVAKGKRKLAEVRRWKLVIGRHIHALDETDTRVARR